MSAIASIISLFLLVLSLLDVSVQGQVLRYYVQSSHNQTCPQINNECRSLPYYMSNAGTYLTSSQTTLVFQSGTHTLNTTLIISDVTSFSLISENKEPTVIQCTRKGGIILNNISSLHIEGLTIMQCGMELTPSLFNNYVTKYSRTLLDFTVSVWTGVFMNYITDLNITNTTIANCTGYGLLSVNLLGNTRITRNSFIENNHHTLEISECFLNASLLCKGGNVMLLYTDLQECPTSLQYTLNISESVFEGGVDAGITFQPFTSEGIHRNDLQLLGGAGLGIVLMQSSYGLQVNITNCAIVKNAAFVGANLYINMFDFVDNTTITIENTKMIHGNNYERFANLLQVAGAYTMAPGYFFLQGMIPLTRMSYTPTCIPDKKYVTNIFSVINSKVSYNVATLNSGGFMYIWPRTFLDFPRTILLDGVQAIENNGDATFINFYLGEPRFGINFKVFVRNSYFSRNFYRKLTNGLETDNPQVHLVNSVQYIEYSNCTWSDNNVSSIRPLQSVVYFRDNNKFVGNIAQTGGAINVREGSMMYFEPNSTTVFEGNYATQYGGAIYAALSSYLCFFQIRNDPNYPPRLEFSNNRAFLAGDAVYSNLENCLLQEGIYTEDALITFNRTSEFVQNAENSTSLLSAPASQLCICTHGEEEIDCTANVLQLERRPGQSLTLSLEGRGYSTDSVKFFGEGLTPTEVIANIVGNDSYARLGSLQSTQSISSHCSEVMYSLYTSNYSQIVQVVLSPQNLRLYTPLILNITLRPCPTGFVLSNDSLQCVCDSVLSDNGVTCDSDTLTITSGSGVWIGTLNTTVPPLVAYGTCVSVHDSCNETVISDLTLDNSDVQCVNHRSGVLCGQCESGYSLAIGSNNCLECSNSYLALLIFFASTGFLLIIFLSFFNITVSTGRLTGLLFFANVIKLSNFKFFSLDHPGFAIFQIFIDWVNLDFGIETCFYNGFDIYTKVWLQYVYLIYLYMMLAAILISAHCSTRISKKMPKNMLGVVTSILLISYVKLLRTTTVAFPITLLSTNEGTVTAWLLDANLTYFSAKHLPLFLFSLILTLFVVIPLALLMLFYPFIWSFSAHEGTRFEMIVTFVRDQLFKMKPFLETFDGPYAPNSRYWTGLLILLRLVIFYSALMIPDNVSGAVLKSAGVTVICIVLLGLVIAFKIFNCPINRRVEFMHLLNLAVVQFVLLTLTLSNQSDISQGIALSISIFIGFVIFVYAIVFENWNALKKPYYRARGKTFVDTRAEHCQMAARQRDLDFNKRQMSNLDSEEIDRAEFIDVLDARKSATRSSVSYVVTSTDEKLEQLKKELM